MHHFFFPLPRCCCHFSRVFIIAVTVAIVASSVGCDFVDDEGPQILAVEVVPSTIKVEETGNHSESFVIEISTANFIDEIETGTAFIGAQERYAEPRTVEVQDNLVYLEGIAYTWFTGMEPGIYDIGVEVQSETAFTREFNRATITIEE